MLETGIEPRIARQVQRLTDRDPSLHAEVTAVWANVTAIVFGASIAEPAARGKTRILGPATDIIARGPAMIAVVPGALAEEGLALYRYVPSLQGRTLEGAKCSA